MLRLAGIGHRGHHGLPDIDVSVRAMLSGRAVTTEPPSIYQWTTQWIRGVTSMPSEMYIVSRS